MATTFTLIRPEAVERGLIADICKRFEKRGFVLIACRMQQAPKALVEKHCEALRGTAGYEEAVSFLLAGPVVAQVWEGADAVAVASAMVGDADPVKAAQGTVRGDLAVDPARNLVECSASAAEAARAIALWFKPDELIGTAAPAAPGALPYGGDVQAAMRNQDRAAIRQIMKARGTQETRRASAPAALPPPGLAQSSPPTELPEMPETISFLRSSPLGIRL